MDISNVAWLCLLGLSCLLLGYVLGSRHSRRIKRRVLQQLNIQSLELLDAKSSLSSIAHRDSEQSRRERLLALTMRKLQQSNARIRQLSKQVETQSKKHYIEVAQLKLKEVECRENAQRSEQLAKQAVAHLIRLEKASPVTQTIEAPAPKSYGAGEAVTVSVVDQPRRDQSRDAVSTMSNRDSTLLSKMRSSNETPASSA